MIAAAPAFADPIRIATFAAPLSRDGPGLLLRDLGREDAQIDAITAIISTVDPDILLLTDVDHDHDGLALTALRERFGYPHQFATRPNSGLMTTLDLDQNGKLGEARDAQGYGRFPGDGGMAILSRWPIGNVTDLSDLLWQDMPGATLPQEWPAVVNAQQRLSSAGHWIAPVLHPEGAITLMAFSATPPVFDGPEDRNGLRNRDELLLWSHILDTEELENFVILGNANLDPSDGEGLRDAMAEFLADPRLQDPEPISDGGNVAANPTHVGDPALDTADWPEDGPGNLRVSYVLPDADWIVADAGVFWPAPDDPLADLLGSDGLAAGPHRLVWVDISR
ncbi:Endonuclease/Exonuclease/phosphatase family protein [Cognatiyoonia koreensis]|uniref:Endonuclease/Exonuclease/phosphatase family protein n=1 Tax=Cognatiyoonia koreensis TaxID=364200 RepID=A0A1I0RX71_9RHOB|nr:Endonuclease/Exonuclease/phosphatase family protein [Cognatiyoonia koreensis]